MPNERQVGRQAETAAQAEQDLKIVTPRLTVELHRAAFTGRLHRVTGPVQCPAGLPGPRLGDARIGQRRNAEVGVNRRQVATRRGSAQALARRFRRERGGA